MFVRIDVAHFVLHMLIVHLISYYVVRTEEELRLGDRDFYGFDYYNALRIWLMCLFLRLLFVHG
jgi:hypothetical protein